MAAALRPPNVWIDLTNSPHVLFFRPIIRRLGEQGVPVTVTARDFAQTLGLLELYGIPHTVIGKHGGAAVAGKALGLARRSSALIRFGRGKGFTIAVSHGSNDLAVAARILRIHSTVIHDFEGATGMHRINFRLADKVMVPEVIPFEKLAALGLRRERYRPYPGIKEQVTLADFTPDPGVLAELDLDPDRPIAVLRPPATMSLYHRGLENTLFDDVLAHLQATDAQVVLLPRTPEQASALAGAEGVTIPARPVDGPSLVHAADLVVSAGGTMNREAALLGVPTWTTFAGELGGVDRMLIEDGRMKVLSSPDELVVEKRPPGTAAYAGLADAVTAEDRRAVTPDAIRSAAAVLADLRRRGGALDRLPPELVPPTIEDAYRVQLELHRQLASELGPRGGWKIGCTTPVMQAYLGIATPSAGTIYARAIQRRAGRITIGTNRLGVECELAVRLGRDLVGDSARDPDAVAGAIEAVMAAIEVVEDRYLDYTRLDAGTLVADDFFGAGCILGPEETDWRGLEMGSISASMTINDVEVGRGAGRDILGDPMRALTWLAATAEDLGEPLRAGQVVLLGSLVQTTWVAAGDRIVVRNDPLGEVHAEVVAGPGR